jgi:hypothetical protein
MLFTSRVGLVNEWCGTHASHEGAVTSNLTVNIILKDVWKIVDLITELANRSIGDVEKRHKVKLQARRYFVLCAIDLLGTRRREGTKLAEVAPEIWRWRRELTCVGLGDFPRLARPLAIIFLPRAMVRLLRPISRGLQKFKSRALSAFH